MNNERKNDLFQKINRSRSQKEVGGKPVRPKKKSRHLPQKKSHQKWLLKKQRIICAPKRGSTEKTFRFQKKRCVKKQFVPKRRTFTIYADNNWLTPPVNTRPWTIRFHFFNIIPRGRVCQSVPKKSFWDKLKNDSLQKEALLYCDFECCTSPESAQPLHQY